VVLTEKRTLKTAGFDVQDLIFTSSTYGCYVIDYITAQGDEFRSGDKECKESRERHPEGKRLTRIRGLGDFVAE
jgi:hypothetical protein